MSKRIRAAKTANLIREARNPAEDRLAYLLGVAEQFESFQTMLPTLKEDLKQGLTSKQLRERYAPLLTAQQISTALTNQDTVKGAEVAEKLLNRIEGKATEHKVVKHQFEELTDQELDAILLSEMDDIEDGSTDTPEH